MKATFAKVLALVLMLALTLSGCNLIEIDAKMQADEDIAKLAESYSKVVASYDGGEVTVGEVMGDFNMAYNEMAYMYYYYMGMEITDEEVHGIMQDVIAQHVRAEIVAAKFDEANTLAEEDLSAMESDVQLQYDENFASALEVVEGKNDKAKQENARVLLYESGVDYDSLYANILTSTKETRMEEILRNEIAEVSEEELQAVYEDRINEQMASYTDGMTFEGDMCEDGVLVCWKPEGYRTVKHILLMPDEEIKSTYADITGVLEANMNDLAILEEELAAANDDEIAEGERTADEIQAEIDSIQEMIPGMEASAEDAKQACLNDVKETVDEIYARLAAGEDFDALIAEYGEDPGMQNEPTMSRGYHVSEASANWEVNFRDAAMALENVGDYTMEPVLSGSGVHIIKYVSDVEAGPVALDEVRDELSEVTLLNLKDAHCEEIIGEWVEAANVSYDVAAFEAIFA